MPLPHILSNLFLFLFKLFLGTCHGNLDLTSIIVIKQLSKAGNYVQSEKSCEIFCYISITPLILFNARGHAFISELLPFFFPTTLQSSDFSFGALANPFFFLISF